MKKSQIEITNIMFMHIIGMLGIVIFTLLFISLMTGSQTRASALKEETIYYNYARRLITSSDCLAYEHIENYFDGSSNGVQSYSKIMPGVIDMSKIFDFDHLNCLRYDLVSGAISNDPKNSKQPFPVLLYEINVLDTDLNKEYFFVSTAFQSKGWGQLNRICANKEAVNYPKSCLISCTDLRNNLTEKGNFNPIGTSMEGINSIKVPTYVNPGLNCWEEDFNDASRAVIPYEGLNCSSVPYGMFEDFDYGNVFETSNQYFSKLRYRMNDNTIVDHDGIINIKFCVINIPTMCDPFFEGMSNSNALGAMISEMGINPNTVFNEAECKRLELPLI